MQADPYGLGAIPFFRRVLDQDASRRVHDTRKMEFSVAG
jgi:hypothetical protein